jgi:hypothetical protein
MKLLPRVALTIAGAAAVIGGIIAAGAWLRNDARFREQHQFAIVEVECEPPPGQTRGKFLEDVQYYGQLPEKLNTLDADVADRLKAAFAKHPKVERVGQVTIERPNRVRVEVQYRSNK